jgi:Glycosyl transferases group 1
MKIQKVVFLGKSKRKTGNTKFMLRALSRRVAEVRFINLPRHRKMYFWTDYKRVIYREIIAFNPDLVLIYSKDIPDEVLQKISHAYKIAIFYPDFASPLDDRLVSKAQLADFLFITNKRQIPELHSLGVNAIFCMQGCDRDEHRVVKTNNRKWASEVAFIGRPSTDYRIELLKSIQQRFYLKAWGARWQKFGISCPKVRIYPEEYARICYATPIMIGCDYNHETDSYFSNRTWITLGCGGFLLTSYQIGLENIFTKGHHLEWYHGREECLDLIDYYLKHEDQRRRIARNGYEFAHAHRTYDVVMDEVLSHIETRN